MEWIREKFAERRAKWLAFRGRGKRPPEDKCNESGDSGATVESCSQDNAPKLPSPLNMKETHIAQPAKEEMMREEYAHSSTPSSKNQQKKSGARRTSSSTCQSSSSGSQDNLTTTHKERVKVRIICPSARVLIFESDIHKRLAELKCEVMLELSDDTVSVPLFAPEVRILSPRYRLFRADNQSVELNENLTLDELQIKNNDTLVFVARRYHVHSIIGQARDWTYPREQDIEKATADVPANTDELPMVDLNEIFYQSNLQFDVRKVLISLAQAAAVIIGAGPYAASLIEMLKQKLINKRNHQDDTVQCLVDMGFTKEKASYALKLNNGVYATALEWLIMSQNEESTLEEAAMSIPRSKSSFSPSGILTNNTIVENTSALLEIVRIYSHRDIPPNQETVNALLEMGFEEADVLVALKKTCNNKAAAAEWLCGNRSGSLIELRDGLSQDSPILKIILELPQVQINLSNPKIFLAFLSILENEQSVRVWGGDNDTTSVITHILQRYHEEKHVMGINQFYHDRP